MDQRTLKLPENLCRRVEERLLEGGDRTLEQLVVFLLEELAGDTITLDEREEALLEQRLRQLGYL